MPSNSGHRRQLGEHQNSELKDICEVFNPKIKLLGKTSSPALRQLPSPLRMAMRRLQVES